MLIRVDPLATDNSSVAVPSDAMVNVAVAPAWRLMVVLSETVILATVCVVIPVAVELPPALKTNRSEASGVVLAGFQLAAVAQEADPVVASQV